MAGYRFALLVGLLAVPVLTSAQITGSIEGAVTDPSGQAIAGAHVLLVEIATNAQRHVESDQAGRYMAAELAPGTYRVEASSAGLKTLAREGLVLAAGRDLRCDFALAIAATQGSVTVTATAQQLDTEPGAWGDSLETRQLASLPLNGRDMFDLAPQQPGAIAPASSVQSLSAGDGAHLSINGSRPSENAFRLDGVYINDATGSAPASAAGRLLGLEAIAELRLVASPFSAEYGRTDGGVITAVSKSGTNDFHGTAYEYLRNSAFDAKNFFDPANEQIPALRRNQFGALLGGPVQKNRLFLLANYEGFRLAASNTTTIETPDAQARNGLVPVGGTLKQVTVAPAILPYLALYPLPNGLDAGDGTGQYKSGVPTRTREDYGTGRLDFVASERLRFSGRAALDNATSTSGDGFHVWNYLSDSNSGLAQASAQYVQSAKTIHDVHLAYSQIYNRQNAAVGSQVSPSLGFVSGHSMGPMSVVGLTDFGGQSARSSPRDFSTVDTQVSYGLNHIGGAHRISAGTSFDRVWFDEVGDQDHAGYYSFSSLTGFLSATPRSVNLMVPGSDTWRHWRMSQFAAFVQDDLRISRHLSAGLGVRYEMATTPTERDGKVATLPNPLVDSAVTLGGPLFVNPSHKNFEPRASLAWDVAGDGRTVVRAGVGIFDDLLGSRELVVAGFRMPPFYNRAAINNPAFPNALAALANKNSPLTVDSFAYRPNQPYTAQYQLLVERALGTKGSAELGYSGSRGIHLVGDLMNINTTAPQVLANGQLYFPANTPAINPSFGQIGMRATNFDSDFNGLLAAIRIQPARRLSVQGKFAWSKSMDDNSIAAYAEFYSLPKVPTVFDYRANRARSDFNCAASFAMNFVYSLPRPAGRATGAILGGWSLSGVAQAQSGNPFNPTVGFDDAHLLSTSSDLGQRPNLVLGQPLILGDPQQYFNPLAYSLPASGYLGNLGRNVLNGPGMFLTSLALERDIWQRESRALRIRGEAFNVSNHPNFQQPSSLALFASTGARVGSAGQITTTTTSSRQIQLSARFSF